MSIRHLSSRIELSFWQVVIGLLSESQPLTRLIRWFCRGFLPVYANFIQTIDRQRFIRWAAAGLGFGTIAGFLISIL